MEKHSFELVTRTHGAAKWNTFLEAFTQLPTPSKAGPWLCGGAVRRLVQDGENVSDWDYFFASPDQAAQFEGWMLQHSGQKVKTTSTNTTWQIGNRTVQAISVSYYASIEEVLDSFDFTICQFGWDGEVLTVGPYALFDLGRKRLALHKLTYGVSTLRRLMKYSKQGFTVCGGVLGEILQRTIENPETIQSTVVSLD